MKKLLTLFILLLLASTTSCASVEAGAAWMHIYGPTTKQDTLWKITKQYHITPQVSLEQVALAIYNANPRAFKHDNMNGLMAGYELTIPTMGDMMATSEQSAIKVVNEQNNAWVQYNTSDQVDAHSVDQPVMVMVAPLPSIAQDEFIFESANSVYSASIMPMVMSGDDLNMAPPVTVTIEQQLQELQTQNQHLEQKLEQQQHVISDIQETSFDKRSSLQAYITNKDVKTDVTTPYHMGQLVAVIAVFLLVVIIVLLLRIYKFTRCPQPKKDENEFTYDNISVISGDDSHDTELDLANAYIELGRHKEAETLLDAVLAQGDQDQVKQAKQLQHKIHSRS